MIELPPSDNPRRKQWEVFFNGTQQSLDYINRMTEISDELYRSDLRRLREKAKRWSEHKKHHCE